MKILVILLLACDCFGNVPKADVLLIPFCICGIFMHSKFYADDVNKCIKLTVLGLLLSMASCFFFRGQSLWASLQALRFYWLICFFFYLSSQNIEIKRIEKGLCLFYFIFIIAYILKWMFPSLKIGMDFNDNSIDNTKNVFLLGIFILPFGFFYYLNKLFKRFKTKYMFFVLLAVLIWFNMGSRTNIVGGIVSFLFMYFHYFPISRINIKHLKFAITLGLFIFLFLQIPIIQESLKVIQEKQQYGSTLDNQDYIRVQQFHYFTQDHFKNIFEYFLGSGMPHGTSAYGQKMLSHGEIGGIVTGWFDWGLIGLSWVVGIFTVFMLFYLYVKIVRSKLNDDFFYLKSIYLFYIITSPFAILSFEGGAFILQSYLLYIFCKKRIR
ncbi:hypothetical protein [Xylanibacter oryzae]|uniref:hypothetical protein n=1 Tax=Xylanibacter oryzae TaxID=185293 RepID=UPI0004BC37A5|nr:hypothetical protein [Xylanibacter oryzae]